MKKLAIQFLTVAIAVIAFSATDAYSQIVGTFKDGKATVGATVNANGKVIYKIPGKKFGKLTIKQTNDGKFKYELRRGSEFLSSGHTTGSNITVNSDGKSFYSITIINGENVARRIDLSFINDGTEP